MQCNVMYCMHCKYSESLLYVIYVCTLCVVHPLCGHMCITMYHSYTCSFCPLSVGAEEAIFPEYQADADVAGGVQDWSDAGGPQE